MMGLEMTFESTYKISQIILKFTRVIRQDSGLWLPPEWFKIIGIYLYPDAINTYFTA